ncbi:protein of unknown function [Noviherbaspirillum humi]|uniref:DUF4382 domain-containing protein n=1 Tax=Noviherbaspirillum humi TaxID=1688639 RepID=A0A239FG49_9BURK|nr:DUF4382 domain-containing protein [Noviherbaspirillum humi]SNS56000.1 protein of unknown function [Noviherbaspirillum humi]
MSHPIFKPVGIASLAAAGLLSACGGGSNDSAAAGTVKVSLTDAPACGFDAVNVTVKKVRIHQNNAASENDSGWTDITLNPARKIDLLKLTNGVLDELGQATLPAGKYTQLRLVLDENSGNSLANSVVPTGGSEVSLDTPSAIQSGIKLVNEFTVEAGRQADLTLDFDACQSVVTKGNGHYAMKPVVKVTPTYVSGIEGYVNKAQLADGVLVTAQQNGAIVSTTAPDATTGRFFLSRLPAGNYDVVLTASNRAASIIGSVPVATTGTIVPVSTAAAPIDLQTAAAGRSISGTVTLASASTSDDPAYVYARQTIANGPTVTIRYRGVDVSTGSASYVLENLPTVAPQFGRYSATLPITFSAQANATPGVGKYTVQAAIGSSLSTTSTVDVSSANGTQNFTLTK